MTGFDLPIRVVRSYIASGIKLVVHLSRLKGGPRKAVQVCEVAGIEDGQYQLEEIFGFEQTGIDKQGRATGDFYATGYRPQCLGRIRAFGTDLPDSLFDEGKRYPQQKSAGGQSEKNGAPDEPMEIVIS